MSSGERERSDSTSPPPSLAAASSGEGPVAASITASAPTRASARPSPVTRSIPPEREIATTRAPLTPAPRRRDGRPGPLLPPPRFSSVLPPSLFSSFSSVHVAQDEAAPPSVTPRSSLFSARMSADVRERAEVAQLVGVDDQRTAGRAVCDVDREDVDHRPSRSRNSTPGWPLISVRRIVMPSSRVAADAEHQPGHPVEAEDRADQDGLVPPPSP